jgi:type VII secretion protein EccCa/type VII secretion protein EccCb
MKGIAMSKRAFVPGKSVDVKVTPVRVSVNAPHPLPEQEPRNMLSMIGVPALVVGLLGTMVMLYMTGVRNLSSGFFPIMSLGGFVMLAFSGRFGRGRKITWGQREQNRRTYMRDLDVDRDEIQKAVIAQRRSQEEAHSNPQELGALIGGPRMWSRTRQSPDFLDVRLGVGVQRATASVLTVDWPEIPTDEELDGVEGISLRDMILEQRKIRDITKVQNLRARPGFSFVGEDLDRVRALVRSVLFMLAVWHDPREVKLMVVTRTPEVWSSLVWLPHARHDELFDACGFRRLIFASPGELEEALAADLHMKGKRRPWSADTAPSPSTTGSTLEEGGVGGGAELGPHLVIVDDSTGSPEAWESVVGQVGKAGITLLRVASRVGVGVGFGKGEVFEMREPGPRGAANVPGVSGVEGDVRPAPLLRAGGFHFAFADQLSEARAYRYARAMARWTPTSAALVADSTSGAATLLRSRGIDDPRALDVDRLWANRRSRADESWGVVPVGAKPNGELQEVVFRAKDFGGFGFHSVVIGTSGSGKSEFFLSLVDGIALTHSPDAFNVIFVDMKFESAAQDILGIPHVSAALSNLGKDERNLSERMRKAIDGEIARRYRLFTSVGARDANDYEEIRLAGRDLEPVPILLVVIDEYLELFHNHPKWIDLIIHIGQEGRGANVFFMLGGQRLDLSSLQKVKSNIAFRVALRAESGDDSREVIQSDAAYNLPSKENGYALLKVGPRELLPFRCFYLSAPFVLPKTKRAAATTVDMLLTEPRVFSHEYQPLSAADTQALEDVASAEDEPDEFLYHSDGFKKKKLVDVLREALIATGRQAPHKPWLEPLEVSAAVDELVRLYRGKPWDVDYGNNDGLIVPLAMEDIPEDARQEVYSVDLLRSNLMAVSAKSRGKTTTLMTVMCSAALMYWPARISFFCIGGATLAAVEALPHVADIVAPSDTEGVVRTLATLEALVSGRQVAFRRDKINIDGFREQRFGRGVDNAVDDDSDVYGDVFLVVDDFNDIYKDDAVVGERIINISGIGPEYGVHVMTSAGGWIHGQRQTLLQNSDVRIQLRLQDPSDNTMGSASLQGREAARETVDRPGFGLNPALHEILIGTPELAGADGERVGTRGLGARVAQVAGVDKHATLKRLPNAIALADIVNYDRESRGQDGVPALAFMIGEQHDLLPVPLALDAHPGMMVLGRRSCGKSATLMAIGEAIMARFNPEQAQITICDINTRLQDLDTKGWGRKYAYDQDSIDETLTELAQQVLLPRMPPKGLTQEELRALKPWEGPRHFVLIDDQQDLRGQQMAAGFPGGVRPPVGAALWKLMEQARRIGLHVFTTRNSSNFGQLEMDPWVKFQRSAKVPVLYMDNSPAERITKTVRAQELPAGRGLLVIGDTDVEGVLVGVPTPLLEQFQQQ